MNAPRPPEPHPLLGREGDEVDLAVVRAHSSNARCRVVPGGRPVVLRLGASEEVAGEILTVRLRKVWSYWRVHYVSGEVLGSRLDLASLELEPLRLTGEGADCGLEQVVPDGEDVFDAVCGCLEKGDRGAARELLADLLERDLRCLEAHLWLGSMQFDVAPTPYSLGQARRHYRVGVGLGDLALGPGFEGRLPWGLPGNRPFLRCLHGLALCHWGLGDHDEARRALERLLQLEPEDRLGATSLLGRVEARRPWMEFVAE